jgi:DNA-binding SARP family transcriptional activator
VHIAELIAEHNPSVDSYKYLAGVYIQGKDKDKAIATLMRAKQLDPQFGPEADTYIKSLQEGKL